MKYFLLAALLLASSAWGQITGGGSTGGGGGSTGNATTINGAAVPASQLLVGTNSNSQVISPTLSSGTIVGVPAQNSGYATPSALVRKTFYATDFGAKCDNSTDDTSALNTFFAAVGAARFQAGILPQGVCRFSSTLNLPAFNSSITGAGSNATWFFYIGSSTTTDLFDVFGASATNLAGPANYSGFCIASGTTMTAGVALHLKYAQHVFINDVCTGSQIIQEIVGVKNLWNGTAVQQSQEIYINGFEAGFTQNDGLQVYGNGAGNPGPQYNLYVNNCVIQVNNGAGVRIGGGWDNAAFDNCDDGGNAVNVSIDNTLSSAGNQEIFFGDKFYTESPVGTGTNQGDNYFINDTLALPSNLCVIAIRGGIFGAVGNGVNVKAWPNCNVAITSPEIVRNTKSGVYVQDTSALVQIPNSVYIDLNSRYGVEASAITTNVNSLAQFGIGSYANTLGTYSSQVVSSALASPPPIGGTTPAAGTFTTLTANSPTGGTAKVQNPVLIQSGIPFILEPSGSFGNNGALTRGTALSRTVPSAYGYFPAAAISSGSAAGWYYEVCSSTTACTVYNNVYSSGTPTIPATPTAFSTTGPGAFTQTTATVFGPQTTMPGNTMGVNGVLEYSWEYTTTSDNNNKVLAANLNNTGSNCNGPQTTGYGTAGGGLWGTISNRGVANVQFTDAGTNNGGDIGNHSQQRYCAVDTTQSQEVSVTFAESPATDYLMLERFSIKVYPN